jgi:hypothetical protein
MIGTMARLSLSVEAAVEGVVVPFVRRRLALGLRQRLLGLQRVVDDDDVGAAPGQHAADRGRDARALGDRLEFGYSLFGSRRPGVPTKATFRLPRRSNNWLDE